MNLKFIVCGLEHSGTTMVSDLFREHPLTESGFECGVLLCQSPREFKSFHPYCDHMEVGWGITKDDLNECCDTDHFAEFFSRLFSKSNILSESTSQIIFDKTPRYITDLKSVKSKVALPTIAVIKDPRSLTLSDFKRSKKPYEEIDEWYESWKQSKISYMRSGYIGYQYAWNDNSCLVIRLEDICFNAKATVKSMFEFVGLEFKSKYLDLKHKRFDNTFGTSISVNSCMRFMEELPKHIQSKVENDFSEFEHWFYPF